MVWDLHVTGLQKEQTFSASERSLQRASKEFTEATLYSWVSLPLQFKQGENADTLGLTGKEVIEVDVDETVRPRDLVTVRAINEDGNVTTFEAVVRFDSEVEIDYYRHGGILQMVLREKMKQS